MRVELTFKDNYDIDKTSAEHARGIPPLSHPQLFSNERKRLAIDDLRLRGQVLDVARSCQRLFLRQPGEREAWTLIVNQRYW